MSLYPNGWIEAHQRIGEWYGWYGVIKVNSLVFNLGKGQMSGSFYTFATKGMPEDASEEVKHDWTPDSLDPYYFDWDNAWKVDSEVATLDWWTLVALVDTLKELDSDKFRFVFWMI